MRNFFAVIALLAVCSPPVVEAAEPVVCSITTDGTSKTTASPTSGSCTWVAGSTVLVSCDQDVYIDSTTSSNVAPTASSADQKLVFTTNQDPVPVYLEPRDKVIAVTQVSAPGTCKFMTVGTRRPR
jgi:hypothetical protein